MVYIRWLLSVLLMIPIMVFCYLTNWFVTLFADSHGELPKIFYLWQTWDSSLDNRTYIMEDCPKFLRYDFDRYYEVYMKGIGYGRKKKCVAAKERFPIKLRFKRYLARTFWLYRNCAYGFAFYLLGVNTDPTTIQRKSEYFSICKNAFRYKKDMPISSHWRWNIYLGWKYDMYDHCRSMLAFRYTVKRI